MHSGRRSRTPRGSAYQCHPHHPRQKFAALNISLIARSQELGLRELYAVAGDTSNFFSGLGFSPVPQDAVSSAVRRKRSYRNRCVASSDIQRLALETRI